MIVGAVLVTTGAACSYRCDDRIAELQHLDVPERVDAVRTARAQIGDGPAAVGVLRPDEIVAEAGIDRGVVAGAAVEDVVAAPAGEVVVRDDCR